MSAFSVDDLNEVLAADWEVSVYHKGYGPVTVGKAPIDGWSHLKPYLIVTHHTDPHTKEGPYRVSVIGLGLPIGCRHRTLTGAITTTLSELHSEAERLHTKYQDTADEWRKVLNWTEDR